LFGIDGVLLPIEVPMREVRFDELLVLPELAAGCLDIVEAEGVLLALEEAERVVFCFSAADADGVLAPIEPPMREVLAEELPGLLELTAVSERPAPRLLRDESLAVSGLAAGCFATVEEGGSDLPMALPIRERDSVVLCLEIDDDGLRLASILFRRELKLEREDLEFVVVCREADGEDWLLGAVTDCLCVVIELPMRDDIEELILPFELSVDRLLMLDLEFSLPELVVVEFLPKVLPILRPLFEVLWFCLELVEGMVIELDLSELVFDCVLGVVMD
jgi:hypothetical protein